MTDKVRCFIRCIHAYRRAAALTVVFILNFKWRAQGHFSSSPAVISSFSHHVPRTDRDRSNALTILDFSFTDKTAALSCFYTYWTNTRFNSTYRAYDIKRIHSYILYRNVRTRGLLVWVTQSKAGVYPIMSYIVWREEIRLTKQTSGDGFSAPDRNRLKEFDKWEEEITTETVILELMLQNEKRSCPLPSSFHLTGT